MTINGETWPRWAHQDIVAQPYLFLMVSGSQELWRFQWQSPRFIRISYFSRDQEKMDQHSQNQDVVNVLLSMVELLFWWLSIMTKTWSCDKHPGGHSIGRQKSWIFSSAESIVISMYIMTFVKSSSGRRIYSFWPTTKCDTPTESYRRAR